MNPPLRVADLFCGPGGISEGFRLAGYEIVFGLDANKDAVATFQHNHPKAQAVCGDATELKPEDMPEFDVLVGGPPCVNFSTSKGSRANVLDGLRLVQTFLRIVHLTKPRYWVMENVPRVARHLPDSIPLRWIGIDQDGELEVPVRNEFNAVDYGVAQRRKRYLIGNYPIPDPTHGEASEESLFENSGSRKTAVTLGDVLRTLPTLTNGKGAKTVTDINYGFEIKESDLTDHDHPVALTGDEIRRIRMVKTEHPYMGRMPFPDETDRPARTVVATQLGRETLVLKGSHEAPFRRATARECATIQSFPLNYQFCGKSIGSRYRQIGDAVPPKLAFNIAAKIAAECDGKIRRKPKMNRLASKPPAPASVTQNTKRQTFPADRRYWRTIPGKEIRGCRIDWDNQGKSPAAVALHRPGAFHTTRWIACLHVGESRPLMKRRVISLDDAIEEFAEVGSKALAYLTELESTFAASVPDATTLQDIFTRRMDAGTILSPDDIAEKISKLVDGHFPKAKFGKTRLLRTGRIDEIPQNGLLLRIAAGAVAAAYVSELANSDSRWMEKNTPSGREHWIPDRRRTHRIPSPVGLFEKLALAGSHFTLKSA